MLWSSPAGITTMNTPHLADPAGAGSFSRYRREWVLLVLLISVQFTFTLFVTVPGYISVDEGTYHMMVKNFSRSGTLEIWNGYEEFPSIELQAASHLRTHNGRLVSQYPYLYAVLATPFYWIFGYRGLFFVNSIVFLVAVLVSYTLARSLFEDRKLALNSCFILVLATYLWEYSQAAWPHAVTVLFVTAAAYCTVRGLKLSRAAGSLCFPAMAGLLIGSGAGIRLDVILAAPALALALALGPSRRIKKTLAFCAGLGPGFGSPVYHQSFQVRQRLTFQLRQQRRSNIRPHPICPPRPVGAGLAVCHLDQPESDSELAVRAQELGGARLGNSDSGRGGFSEKWYGPSLPALLGSSSTPCGFALSGPRSNRTGHDSNRQWSRGLYSLHSRSPSCKAVHICL